MYNIQKSSNFQITYLENNTQFWKGLREYKDIHWNVYEFTIIFRVLYRNDILKLQIRTVDRGQVH